MVLDNEVQRTTLLQIFDGVSFPGNALEVLYELKQAVKNAVIDPNWQPAPPNERPEFANNFADIIRRGS